VGGDTYGYRPETVGAIDAVTRGLEVALRGVGADEITSKGPRDLVTATDVAVEDEVRRLLSESSAVPVVGEERGGAAPADGSPYWLLDPICGTRNFASGLPLYSVNLALVESGRVTVGVVGDPSTGEILVAERGRGAWTTRDGVRRELAVSGESRIVVLDDGHSGGSRRERAATFAAGAIRADRWDFRALGTTLSLAHVAAGRIATYLVFWGTGLHTAAGSLLAAEAGATVSDVDGQPWTIDSDSIVASADPELHRELVGLAGSASSAAG